MSGRVDRHLFGLFLEAKRIVRGLTRPQLAFEADVPAEAVRRAVDKQALTPTEFRRLCRWQGEDPSIFKRA